jgi:hypothetical protein
MLDCETMKTYADSKDDRQHGWEPAEGTFSHRVAETRDRSYTPLRPIPSRLPGGVRGIA